MSDEIDARRKEDDKTTTWEVRFPGPIPNMRIVKTIRYFRRLPRAFWLTFREPIATSNQLFMTILAWLVLALTLRIATPEQRDVLATEWTIWLEAAVLTVFGWAAVSLLYAPYRVSREERSKGQWFANRFLYHRPVLVAVERCIATGDLERFKIRFEDAEPNSFVFYTIEVEERHLLPHMFVGVFSDVWMRPDFGRSILKAGFRLPTDRTAWLAIKIKGKYVSQTVRVYMHSFAVGNPMDDDGVERRPTRPAHSPR
jgi:hypothetical protein